MKLYLVSEGDYSDYRVRGVYSTRDLAEEATKRFDGNEIEEFDLDAMPESPPGLYAWSVDMLRDGEVKRARRRGCDGHDGNWSHVYLGGYAEKEPYLTTYVWAVDEIHAIKVANERRARMIALGEWDAAIEAQKTKDIEIHIPGKPPRRITLKAACSRLTVPVQTRDGIGQVLYQDSGQRTGDGLEIWKPAEG